MNVDGQNSKTTDKNAETLNITIEPEPLNETNDVLVENSKISKSLSKLKDSPSSSEISSSNSSNVGHVSRSGRKIKPKKYSDYENDAEVPKRPRLSKENSKTSEKCNNGSNETDTSSEQNYKTKGKPIGIYLNLGIFLLKYKLNLELVSATYVKQSSNFEWLQQKC